MLNNPQFIAEDAREFESNDLRDKTPVSIDDTVRKFESEEYQEPIIVCLDTCVISRLVSQKKYKQNLKPDISHDYIQEYIKSLQELNIYKKLLDMNDCYWVVPEQVSRECKSSSIDDDHSTPKLNCFTTENFSDKLADFEASIKTLERDFFEKRIKDKLPDPSDMEVQQHIFNESINNVLREFVFKKLHFQTSTNQQMKDCVILELLREFIKQSVKEAKKRIIRKTIVLKEENNALYIHKAWKRVHEGEYPNEKKNQQMKDCVILEHLLEFNSRTNIITVFFCTFDKGLIKADHDNSSDDFEIIDMISHKSLGRILDKRQ